MRVNYSVAVLEITLGFETGLLFEDLVSESTTFLFGLVLVLNEERLVKSTTVRNSI